MAAYTIRPDGTKFVYARYTKKGVLTLNHIFPSGPQTAQKYIKKKKGFVGQLQHIHKVHDNTYLVRKIFTTFLLKVMTRVADGELFMLPGKTQAHIVLKPYSDELTKGMRKKGFYADYDIVKANFKIPRFSVDFGPFSRKPDFLVYVPVHLRQRALKNAENRQIEWTTIPKTLNRDVQYDGCDAGDL